MPLRSSLLSRHPSLFRVLAVLVLVGCAHLGWAQGLTVFGTVTDSSDAVVSKAQVTLTNVATQQARISTSTDDGTYVIPSIVPGEYRLTVTMQGFETFVAQNTLLQVDENRRIPVKLVGSDRRTEARV